MRHIANLKALISPSGEPYTLPKMRLDENDKPVKKFDHEGNPLLNEHGEELFEAEQFTPSLAEWIDMVLGAIPAARATMVDSAHCGTILRACHQNEGSIDLEEADYEWLMKIMFDDAKGKFFAADKAEGALTVQCFGLVRADAIKRAIEGKEEGEVAAGPIPMNRAARRRAAH